MVELHEQFVRAPEKEERASNRKFGIAIGTILLLIACLHGYFRGDLGAFNLTLGSVGAMLLFTGLIWPDGLAPFNYAWSKLGLVLHKITNPLFLGAMFLLVIVPTGLIMRLFRADPMKRRFVSTESYRVDRAKPRSTRETLRQLY